MIALIDAHMVGEGEAGNETYIINLVRGLQSLEVPDRFLLATSREASLSTAIHLDEQFQPVSVSPSALRRIFVDLPRIAKERKADVMHVTYAGPLCSPCPLIATIHDVSYKERPAWFSLRDRIVLGFGVPLTIRSSAAVLTLSENSRDDICKHYRQRDKAITVTPLAPAVHYQRIDDTSETGRVLARYGIDKPYVLAVGNLQPRKNLPALIDAFADLKHNLDIPHSLVVVGKDAYGASSLRRTIGKRGLRNSVVLTGYVDGDALPALYSAADVFAYPSLYEGFGLPVLEAMACGTPVVTSNVTSMPEVAGDAAVLVDPSNVRSIADGLERVLTDSALRAELSRKGSARAREFSWKKTAQLTYDAYRRVVDANGQ